MKFTFKKNIPTGQWRSFEPESHLIKFNKKECGSIFSTGDGMFKVSLAVKCQAPPGWKNTTFLKRQATVIEAKEWLNDHINDILTAYTVHYFED